MQQNSSSTCICSMYLSQLIRYFRTYGSYRDFLDRGSLNKKATETRIPSGYVEVITAEIVRSPP